MKVCVYVCVYLLYKDESVCVCMCVCVYVRRPAGGPTQPITPKFGVGSSFHPGSAPSQGATQNVGPQGYLPYWPCLKFPEGLRTGWGPANKSCSSGWVFNVKFYFRGAHPNLGPAGSTLPNGGVCFENWAGASKQKLLLKVGLYIQILFVGGSPQPKARRVLRSICTGLFHNEIVK